MIYARGHSHSPILLCFWHAGRNPDRADPLRDKLGGKYRANAAALAITNYKRSRIAIVTRRDRQPGLLLVNAQQLPCKYVARLAIPCSRHCTSYASPNTGRIPDAPFDFVITVDFFQTTAAPSALVEDFPKQPKSTLGSHAKKGEFLLRK